MMVRDYYEALQKKGVIVAATFPSGEQVDSREPNPESTLPPLIAVKTPDADQSPHPHDAGGDEDAESVGDPEDLRFVLAHGERG